MEIVKTYKYRIYPTKKQQTELDKQFGACRFVFNYFLRQRIDYYADHKGETKQGLTLYDTCNLLTELKKQPELSWLKESHAQSLQCSLRDLDRAYNNFFNKRAKFPKFKKKYEKQSCMYPQPERLVFYDKTIKFPKLGDIKCVFHRPYVGSMCQVVIKKTKTSKYFVFLVCKQTIIQPDNNSSTDIGIDLGLKSFLVTSNGDKVDNPRFLVKSSKRLKRLCRNFSASKKGSNNFEKKRLRLARLYEKVSNQRQDFLHKLSHDLVVNNHAIGIEDLAIKNMVRNNHLSKSISDAGWGYFINMLEYKGVWYGCEIRKVGRFFPSSKRCNVCGYINQELNLSIREWLCPECNTLHDRDINAARNILKFCTVGNTGTYACGDSYVESLNQESSCDEFHPATSYTG